MHRAMRGMFLLFVLAALACNLERQVTPAPEKAEPSSTETSVAKPEATPLPPGHKAPKPAPPDEPTDGEAVNNQATTPAALPTPDPRLPGWTVLVYMNADNDLDGLGLGELNDMEAAGESPRTNVLVQLDRAAVAEGDTEAWSDARRYEVRLDDDAQVITSTVAEELGEVNMGDAETLADFIDWGIRNYPANHYALILWHYGEGWTGIAYDDSHDDALSMIDLSSGLQEGLERADRVRLNIVGFDASLMGQLDVYQAIQPYADIAVASEELIPAEGWDYGTLLQVLHANSAMEPVPLAEEMVSTYITFYDNVSNEFVTMAAVDLRKIPEVTAALDRLANELLAEPQLASAAVGDARRGADAYALVYPNDAEHYASVDLRHFASILARRSPNRAVTAAANAVMDAVTGAVIAEAHGAAFQHSAGISFYFPRTTAWYQDQYASLGLPSWNNFLRAYYSSNEEEAAPPTVHIAHVEGTTANAQAPAYFDFEITGRDIENIYVMGGRREDDGRLRLVEYDTFVPEPTILAENERLYEWRDGVHEDFYVWNTSAPYLSDGANGSFVVLWPTSDESDLYAVEGQYIPQGGEALEATLLFDVETRVLQSIWSYHGGEKHRAPRELKPVAGDGFQVYDIYLGQDNQVSYEPGATFVFTDGMTLTYDYFPLPSGEYTVGFRAQTRTGETAEAFSDITVNNDALIPGYQAYLDPYEGFQFLYPLNWPRPTYQDGRLYTNDPEANTRLTVSLYPGRGLSTPNELKIEALRTFGAVDILYEESITVGEENAMMTAYGYEADDGEHTGVFLSFVSRNLNMGFVVDVDGLMANEASTLELVGHIIDSWQHRPIAFGQFPGEWSRLEVDNLNVAVPSNYTHEVLENGWQLFRDGATFVAVRTDPVSGLGRPALVDKWLDVAGEGVEGFEVEAPYRVALGEKIWWRSNFSYGDGGVPIWGFVMATVLDGYEVIAWGEASSDVYNNVEQTIFLTLVADALKELKGESGLLFEATFDDAGTWGIGDMEGAEGRVAEGVYELSVEAKKGFFWSSAGESFGNGTFELDVMQTEGPLDNGYGMLFGLNHEQQSFYVYEVSSDGYIWIGYCEEGCARAQVLVADGWFFSPAVEQGLEVRNRLRVEADGTALHFYVNGVEVGTVDGAAPETGDVGLFVETLEQGGVEVAFDNFRVTAR